jgi:uracil-DNA glycosylase
VPPTTALSDAATARDALAFLLAAGCDVPVQAVPRNWLDAPPPPAPPRVEPGIQPAPASARPAATSAAIAAHPALACDNIDALQALLGRFPDARTRPPLLFEGAIDARVWILIDRPDHDPAHRQTIDRMIAAIDLDWTRAALVSRLPWPTPGDGEPTAGLLARFTPVVERLAVLAPPTHVLALGQLAAELAGPAARPVSSRGRWFDWGGARLLPSIHPRTMRGSKELRAQAFDHLKLFRQAIG